MHMLILFLFSSLEFFIYNYKVTEADVYKEMDSWIPRQEDRISVLTFCKMDGNLK